MFDQSVRSILHPANNQVDGDARCEVGDEIDSEHDGHPHDEDTACA